MFMGVLGSVLQRNRTSSACTCAHTRVCVCVYVQREKKEERERWIFKELVHAILELGKSKVCRVGQQAGDPQKSQCCNSSPQAVC